MDKPREFRKLDRVSWCGCTGTITEDKNFRDVNAAPLKVVFDEHSPSFNPDSGNRQVEYFMRDGRLHSWHKEPSLKLIEAANV